MMYGLVIVAVNESKDLSFLFAFYFFSSDFGDFGFLLPSFPKQLFARLISNIFIKSIIENILQFLISNLLIFLQKYHLDFAADLTKVETYFYGVLIILLYSKYNRNQAMLGETLLRELC